MSLTTFMHWVSTMSSLWAYCVIVPVVAASLYQYGRRRLALATVLVTAGNLLNPIIKNVVQRPRPTDGFDGYSFPSGHALGAMVFYGFLAYCAWREGRRRSAVGAGVVILLVGLSRVVLGAHYATDVLAGYLIGVAWLVLYLNIPSIKRLMT